MIKSVNMAALLFTQTRYNSRYLAAFVMKKKWNSFPFPYIGRFYFDLQMCQHRRSTAISAL